MLHVSLNSVQPAKIHVMGGHLIELSCAGLEMYPHPIGLSATCLEKVRVVASACELKLLEPTQNKNMKQMLGFVVVEFRTYTWNQPEKTGMLPINVVLILISTLPTPDAHVRMQGSGMDFW